MCFRFRFGVWGLGFGGQDLIICGCGLGFEVYGLELSVQDESAKLKTINNSSFWSDLSPESEGLGTSDAARQSRKILPNPSIFARESHGNNPPW